MKKYLLILFSLLLSLNLFSQTYTSSADGNWLSPTTWSPPGIPLPGATVIIDHNVLLDTHWTYSSGSITVNGGGSLVQSAPGRNLAVTGSGVYTNDGMSTIDIVLMNGGTFTNNGTFEMRTFANYGNLDNFGSIIKIDSFYNDGIFDNSGTIRVSKFYNDEILNNYGEMLGRVTDIDSFTNANILTNHPGAQIITDSALNIGTFTNNGYFRTDQFKNDNIFTNNDYIDFSDMSNFGIFTNNDSMLGMNSAWNTEVFNNNAYMYLANSFLNGDTVVQYDAVFNADGIMQVAQNWWNFDTIRGSVAGRISVGDTSYNSGYMLGSFDLCDLTPPASAPFIDYNLGTIDSTVTWCSTVATPESHASWFSLYPNPNSGEFAIATDLAGKKELRIYDLYGNLVHEESSHDGTIRMELQLSAGLYFVEVRAGRKLQREKMILRN